MDDDEGVRHWCMECQSQQTFTLSDTGNYTCNNCFTLADDIFDVSVYDEFNSTYNISQSQRRSSQHHSQLSQSQPDNFDVNFDIKTEPIDSGFKEFDAEVTSSSIRDRYLAGLRVIIQLQCEALVDKFGVSPLIVGLVGPIWLRFLVCRGVTSDEWSDKAVYSDEEKEEGVYESNPRSDRYVMLYPNEHFSIYKKRLVMIWFRSLTRKVPISSTLAVSFLVCHLAREPVLQTDIMRWALEGNLPYLSAFTRIEEYIGRSPDACRPIRDARMFKTFELIPTQKLEAEAAKIAEEIGLDLPPVNFYAIASRYCRALSFPCTQKEKILDTACKICEWSAPPELHISENEFRYPTRVCVMSVLIVAIRMMFNISGYGFWESSLSDDTNSCSRPQSHSSSDDVDEVSGLKNSKAQDSNSSAAAELLQILEAKYCELDEEMFRTELEGRGDCPPLDFDYRDFSSNLSSYLKYCEDVIFPEKHDSEETHLWKEFHDFYQKNKDKDYQLEYSSSMNSKRSRKRSNGNSSEQGKFRNSKDDNSTEYAASHHCGHYSNCSTDQDDDCPQDDQMESPLKDRAIRQLKLDMEENHYSYIPPKSGVKHKGILHYRRKIEGGVYTYPIHADFYILLRSCAKVAQVETRVMHSTVLRFERRLKWLENRIADSLNLSQNLESSCDFCRVES